MQGEAYLGGRILIVDDEESNVVLLQRMLARAGYGHLTGITDSRNVLQLFQEVQPDLVLLDLMMPHLDGFAVMEQLAVQLPEGSYVPILVLTADVTPEALRRALSAGARDFLTKPFDQTELLLRVKNLLETRFLYLGLHHQVQSLEQINVQAENAVRFRDESLSEISHDLGQPLTALKLTTESLKQEIDEAPDPKTRRMAKELGRVDAAADQIAAMISELSDLARLQMGRELVLQRRTIDLISLAQNIVDDLKNTARRHHLRVESSVGELVGDWDKVRLQRVLSNLLSNAIKFSPAGGEVVVSIDSISQDGTPRASIVVRDQGIGIPEADLPHIFDRFYRGRNVISLIEGTGIGLSGAKQIVDQHGGSIEVESVEGHGTTVTVILPIKPPS